MALTVAATSGSVWRNVIMAAFHLVVPATGGLTTGLPICMKTRAVPAHLLLSNVKDWDLLDTFDSIPLYALGAATQNTLVCEYPDGTWTEVACVQE